MTDTIILLLVLCIINLVAGFLCAKFSLLIWKETKGLEDDSKMNLQSITYLLWPMATMRVPMLNKKFLPINCLPEYLYTIIMTLVGFFPRALFNVTILIIRIFLKTIIPSFEKKTSPT